MQFKPDTDVAMLNAMMHVIVNEDLVGKGVAQHVQGTDNARCLIALALMTGQIGRPGTGLHPLRGQNNVQGASDAGLIPIVYPDYQPVERDETRALFEAFWGVRLDPKRGLTVTEIIGSVLKPG